ncbi:voltage-gated potassium channel [Nonlabens dokdonensis]|jgi:voltage-gated potassium channel|uniref:Cation transporter n=2 Tax=Nonlabens dokdonensis TaxID=328515 RepID=L7WFH7_NONDD|nr:ion transporter [Nonlabens dokdonensis]AGC78711.1 cation transporter [Nonlabens dokdonensis DSW-6]PZX39162.1 voltage-gated potassium channel [Nonlabens dokdonensis]
MGKDDKHISSQWRRKIHEVIYEADTPAGKIFDVTLLIVIIISLILVMLESVPELGRNYKDEFIIAEWVITVFFTIEYVLRIISINKPFKYIFSFFGIIDFISTIPLYLTFFFGGLNALLAVRSLRLLRIFRILKITRYIGEADKLSKAIRSSGPKIAVFLFAVMVVSIIFGTLMYLIEGPEHGFDSIPKSIYWCIVTLTTVGFGDIAPETPFGQFLAAVIMIMGYGIIAVPTGIVSAEYSKSSKEEEKEVNPQDYPDYRHVNTQVCQNCLSRKHQDGALFCHNCGTSLDD